jgi:hypothetical protein
MVPRGASHCFFYRSRGERNFHSGEFPWVIRRFDNLLLISFLTKLPQNPLLRISGWRSCEVLLLFFGSHAEHLPNS